MSNRAKTFLLILIELLLLFVALAVTVTIRDRGITSEVYLYRHLNLFIYVFPIWIIFFFIEGLYSIRTYNPAGLPVSLIRAITLSTVTSFIFFYFLPKHLTDINIAPKSNLFIIAILSFALIYIWRRFFYSFFSKVSRLRQTVLIGSTDTMDLVNAEIIRKPYLGFSVLASIAAEDVATSEIPKAELVAVERSVIKDQNVLQKVFALLGTETEVMDLAKFAEKVSGKIPLKSIDESWFIEYCGHQDSKSYDMLKNLIDTTVAILLLILLIPLAIIILPILLIVHGRPIFFSQKRTGLNNKPFTLYKIRSMVVDAEKNGVQWAKPGDARITPLGKFLRKTRIDELPQLINIIRGEMSLVGPRPERPEMIAKELAPTIPFYNLRHLVKPGVTGWAQVNFRYGFSQQDTMEKLQLDLFYVKNRNIWVDIIVILKTVKTVLTGAGQ